MEEVIVPDSVMELLAMAAGILAIVVTGFVVHGVRARRTRRRILKAAKVSQPVPRETRTTSGRRKKRK